MNNENELLDHLNNCISEVNKFLKDYKQSKKLELILKAKQSISEAANTIQSIEFNVLVDKKGEEILKKVNSINIEKVNLVSEEKVEKQIHENNQVTVEPELVETTEKELPVTNEEHHTEQIEEKTTNSEIEEPISPQEKPSPTDVKRLNLNETVGEKSYTTDLNNSLDKNISIKLLSFDLNDRLFFQKELFNNDPYEFHVSMNQIKEHENLETLMPFIENELSNKYNWDNKSEAKERFISNIKNKV